MIQLLKWAWGPIFMRRRVFQRNVGLIRIFGPSLPKIFCFFRWWFFEGFDPMVFFSPLKLTTSCPGIHVVILSNHSTFANPRNLLANAGIFREVSPQKFWGKTFLISEVFGGWKGSAQETQPIWVNSWNPPKKRVQIWVVATRILYFWFFTRIFGEIRFNLTTAHIFQRGLVQLNHQIEMDGKTTRCDVFLLHQLETPKTSLPQLPEKHGTKSHVFQRWMEEMVGSLRFFLRWNSGSG